MLCTVVLAALLVGIAHAQNYCALCSDHTMCKYPGTGTKCQRIIARGISQADQNEIINKHNELRNKVALGQETRGSNGRQPAASNMKKVTWDPELATVAQRWADQCDFGHDKCRNVERFGVGQNAYLSYGGCNNWNSKVSYSSAVESWYNEVDKFNKNNINPFQFTMDTGHYTQVVWADTYKIGCGYASFQNGNQCNNYVVCNYGPAGNMIGAAMYKQGAARSACSNSPKDNNYPGLCG